MKALAFRNTGNGYQLEFNLYFVVFRLSYTIKRLHKFKPVNVQFTRHPNGYAIAWFNLLNFSFRAVNTDNSKFKSINNTYFKKLV